MSLLNLKIYKFYRPAIYFISLSTLIFLCPLQSAQADVPGLPPAGNVSCSTTDEGMNFGISMTFENSITITDWSYTWMYSKLVSGAPNLVSSYGPPMLLKSTTASGLRLTYAEILTLAGGNPNATILVTVGVRNGSVTNAMGRGCYFDLPSVLESVKQAELAATALTLIETKSTEELADQLTQYTSEVDSISGDLDNLNSSIMPIFERFEKAISDIREQITSLSQFVLDIKLRLKVKA